MSKTLDEMIEKTLRFACASRGIYAPNEELLAEMKSAVVNRLLYSLPKDGLLVREVGDVLDKHVKLVELDRKHAREREEVLHGSLQKIAENVAKLGAGQ